jgi:ADP-heptose:LPS heptosyltransferase
MGKVKSVFIGLYWTLGDIITLTAITRATKEKYPDANITVAIGKDYVDVFENNPDVNVVIGCSHPDEIILRAGAQNYDRVFLPLMRTNLDTLWHQTEPWCIDGDRHNLVDFYASRCEDDLVINNRKTYLYPQQKHWDEIVANIPDQFKSHFTNTPFITFHTTSRNPSKDWPYEKWVELAKRLKEKYSNLEIYQVGGNDDKVLPKPATPLTGIPILNTAAILQRSLIHIDVDSGPSFIADSVGTKTVVIFGATSPNMAGPLSDNVVKIDPVRECIGTATHCPCATKCLINKPCIDTITVDQVFDVIVENLDKIIESKKQNAVNQNPS